MWWAGPVKTAWAGDEAGLYSWLSSSISIEQWFFRQVKLKVTFCEATKMSKKNQVVFVYFKPLNWSAWSGYVGDKNEHHGHEQDQKHRPHNRNHEPLLRVVHLIILVDKTNCFRFSIWQACSFFRNHLRNDCSRWDQPFKNKSNWSKHNLGPSRQSNHQSKCEINFIRKFSVI